MITIKCNYFGIYHSMTGIDPSRQNLIFKKFSICINALDFINSHTHTHKIEILLLRHLFAPQLGSVSYER